MDAFAFTILTFVIIDICVAFFAYKILSQTTESKKATILNKTTYPSLLNAGFYYCTRLVCELEMLIDQDKISLLVSDEVYHSLEIGSEVNIIKKEIELRKKKSFILNFFNHSSLSYKEKETTYHIEGAI